MKRLLLLFFCCWSLQGNSQDLISITELGVVSQQEMIADFGPFMQFGVRQYKMVYTSTDLDGNPATLSGLLLIPDQPSWIFPSLIYQHGTVGSPEDVPSNLQGGYELGMVFAGRGFITYAPDFLGLGESDVFHPYVHAESEALAAIDMLYAGGELGNDLFSDLTIIPNDQLFITGYSQGGHAAMAAYKYIQEEYSNDFDVTAAAPMSGPYDISGVMKDLSLTTTENYSFPAYIVYTALSFNEAYGNLYTDLEEFFRPEYVPMIEQFYNDDIDLFTLNQFLIGSLTNEYGGSYPYYLLQDSISNALANDPTHPANVALADNDLYDWLPEAPTRIYYCTADDQVPYQNSIQAETYMLANGAPDLEAIDVLSTADHGGCVEPATIATIFFFAEYAEYGPYLSTAEASASGFSIGPNPATDKMLISFPEDLSGAVDIQLIDLQGRRISSWQTQAGTSQFELLLPDVPQGIYTVEIRTENNRFFEKVILQ